MSASLQPDHPAEPSLSALVTEQDNPASRDIDRKSALEIVQIINAEDARVAAAVEQELPQIARAIEAIAARLRGGGRLIYMGAGTSGRLGALDASECPPTFNVPPELVIGWVAGGPAALSQASEDLEDSAEAGRDDAARLQVGAADALVAITASGRTPYALGAAHYAREQGALTIGLACNRPTPLEAIVEIMIAPIVGPEVITGSTRMKAGTAQKMVLNMLSTGTMILLGKTYGNLMVDVQATNYKLQQRALRIVQLTTGLERSAAEELLAQANGEVKTAIVCARSGLDPQSARQRLAEHGFILRATLDSLS
ncbi:N-acetylmuramic acid 6-phosphate etherase [Thermogemmatispora aurantia]|uniref:N-acetylmuramic acid 6-phosphate etherase n=1 Tax=Thermogemmatispora aurantia TaxID=2045279 RepID=A0A5J4K3U2_9CHLR|nr:N-acetylmuramic acid 6-phosphate etherase [Thermogemmatispora aurantia]GER81389.1 N-acetylmuramic acid 6-phosphate etherase [Thermogemmatispora aurantia]